MVLSTRTIESGRENLQRLMSSCSNPEGIRNLREAISEATQSMGDRVEPEEIWVDLPEGPKFKEAIECPIKSVGEENGYTLLRSVFPVDDWSKAFSENKWRGYVFSRPEKREIVHRATKQVLKEAFDIRTNKFSLILCKME